MTLEDRILELELRILGVEKQVDRYERLVDVLREFVTPAIFRVIKEEVWGEE